jgi:hypothetical protein
MKIRTGLAAAVLAALVAVPVAAAAPPAHDTYGGAESIASVPFAATVDTSEATTDADDVEANQGCGAPATEASVWYAYSAGTGNPVTVDVSQSDYSAGVIVVTGSPGSFQLVTCGPGSVVFTPMPGETYSILAFDDTTGGTNGGTLRLSMSEAAAAQVDLEVNPTASLDRRTGVATISGTLTCSGASEAFVHVSVSQRVGRFTISGANFTLMGPCDGAPHPWSLEVEGSNGTFAGGRAQVDGFASACGPFGCAFDEVHREVRFRR